MEENEIRLAKMKELIAQTERKLQKCFIEKGIKSLAETDATQRFCSKSPEITTKLSEKKTKKITPAKILTKPAKRNLNINDSENNFVYHPCCKKKAKPPQNINNYEKIMHKMDLKKVRLYDQMNKLEGKPVISAYKEKKLKYEISVLKAELLHEKNNKKKLACELEKYKNRYKLNNFHSEALAN